MDDLWLIAASAAAGAGVGVLGTVLTNLFLVGQRRAQATYQVVQAQHLVIKDLRAAYEGVLENPALKEWLNSPPEKLSNPAS